MRTSLKLREVFIRSCRKILFLFTVTATAAVGVKTTWTGREEIVCREFDFAENIARTVGGIITLLFGYAEIVYRH